MTAKSLVPRGSKNSINYSGFDQLDGSHPWMEALPTGYVPYRVRELQKGEVVYFNFILAKEMGLIASDHPNELNDELTHRLLSTFSIQIINEYDELSKKRIAPETIKPKMYMATRYLQLQHSNKQGKTSGDGRSIWNGTIRYKGKVWDVSSRGTGVTCLSPGAVQAGKPLKTGEGEFGYGCGLAEIDELYSAAIMAEIMHLQGVSTERVLAVIDLGNGYGIGVRAAANLIRPAHLFMYLKQDRLPELKSALDYLIQRQYQNSEWDIDTKASDRYLKAGQLFAKSFAQFAARLETDYIFAWLDWDGDNVLANAGIIDYGSVRQFGIRHDKYRYDDIERFSTNLNEQKTKARLITQVFAQAVDYATTGKKKPLRQFATSEMTKAFNGEFEEYRNERMLYRMGFSEIQRKRILSQGRDTFKRFEKVFMFFETAKVSGSEIKVPDGVNHPALYNMRAILKSLPAYFKINQEAFDLAYMPEELFYKTILSKTAKAQDARLGKKHRQNILKFLKEYKELMQVAAGKQSMSQILVGVAERSSKLNSEKRVTGNALIQIVDELLTQTKKGMPSKDVQKYIDRLIIEHVGLPEVKYSRHFEELGDKPIRKDVYSRLLKLVAEHQHDI
jgi:uncharacterized protein YdiU (UPF0061 family)